MNLILWLIMGGVVGWVAGIIMGTGGRQGILLNVLVGIVGALIGGWLIAPLLGTGTIYGGITITNFVVSLIGALVLLALLRLLQRNRIS